MKPDVVGYNMKFGINPVAKKGMERITIMNPLLIAISMMVLCGKHPRADNIVYFSGRESCKKLYLQKIKGYYGFPVAIPYDFGLKYQLFDMSNSNLTVGHNITCVVMERRTGTVVNRSDYAPLANAYLNPMELAYEIPEMTSHTEQNFTIKCGFPMNYSTGSQGKVDKAYCVSNDVRISLHYMLSPNCTGNAVKSKSVPHKLKRGDLNTLDCDVTTWRNWKNITREWFRYANKKCGKKFGNDTIITNNHELQFKSADFDVAGTYMCVATFNNRKLVLKKYNVCIQYKPIRVVNMKFKCNDRRTATNNDVNLTCTIKLQIGNNRGHYLWYKVLGNKTTEICSKLHAKENKTGCSEVSSVHENICYFSEPAQRPSYNIKTISLTIRDVAESDFGLYVLKYYGRNIDPIVGNITLKKDVKVIRERQSGQILYALIFLVVFAVFLVGCYLRKTDILWFHKKHFGKCEKSDSCNYTVQFLYTYDASKSDDCTIRNTKNLVECVEEIVKELGGTIYDQNKDIAKNQFEAENIMEMHDDCQRIILFLSPAFVQDDWNRFASYTAMEAAIRHGKKIILFTMPGTRAAIQEAEKDARTTLLMAMKRNITIHWKGGIPLNGISRRRLEYALPKLRKAPLIQVIS